jgi:6-phosphogluconolactonase
MSGRNLFDAEAGRLSPNNPDVIKGGARPRHRVLHPSSKYVYCVNEGSGLIDTFAIDDKTGVLTQTDSASRPDLPEGHVLAADLHVSPDGQYLYASARAGSTISVYAIDAATGTPPWIQTIDAEKLPRSFGIDPSGRYLISAGQDTGNIEVHAIDRQTGKLALLASYPAGLGPSWVEFVDLGA